MATAAVIVAILSLAVSSVTAWLTLFRRGTVTMTQPTVIYFGPEGRQPPGRPTQSKVYFRTLLFATSKTGRVIETMHVVLSHKGTDQNFTIWVYGDHQQLVRGSGLFVGETGIATSHHFLLSPQAGSFRFTEGRYKLDVFARLLGDGRAKRLFTQELTVSSEAAASMAQADAGLYFDWDPDSGHYPAHIDKWDAPRDGFTDRPPAQLR
jgi:hypothetical protein